MFWNRSASQVIAHSQTKIERNLEMGQQPLLNLGISQTVLDNLQAWSALQELAATRADMTRPILLAGGQSATWLATLLHARLDAPERSPNLFVAYAGPDQSTYMAIQTTHYPQSTALSQTRPASLPPALINTFAPLAQPAVAPPWSALPFVAIDEIFIRQTLDLQANLSQQRRAPQWFAQLPNDYISLEKEPSMISENNWLAWISVVFTLALFLTALLL